MKEGNGMGKGKGSGSRTTSRPVLYVHDPNRKADNGKSIEERQVYSKTAE
jgi:hypothetical protein